MEPRGPFQIILLGQTQRVVTQRQDGRNLVLPVRGRWRRRAEIPLVVEVDAVVRLVVVAWTVADVVMIFDEVERLRVVRGMALFSDDSG